LDFRELLSKKKSLGEWRLAEELAPVVDKLMERDSLIKLMDSALASIEEVLPEYKLSVLARLFEYVANYFMDSVLDVASDYVVLRDAWEKLIPHIVMAALSSILDAYEEYLTARSESVKTLWRADIEKYSRLLKKYAERYPEETARGLLLFVNAVDTAVRQIGREIVEFGHPLA
jgi:hypothetical protein